MEGIVIISDFLKIVEIEENDESTVYQCLLPDIENDLMVECGRVSVPYQCGIDSPIRIILGDNLKELSEGESYQRKIFAGNIIAALNMYYEINIPNSMIEFIDFEIHYKGILDGLDEVMYQF